MNRDKRLWMGGVRAAGMGALLLAALMAGACGDGDDGGTSGVDGDKSLDALSPAEATDLCEWGTGLIDDEPLTRFACYAAALVFAEDREACEAIAQECIDESEPIDRGDVECTFEDPPACASEVTVAEIEACGRDAADVLIDLAEEIDCDSDPEQIEELALAQPASCQLVEDKCPELFEDDEDDAGAGSLRRIQRWARGAGRTLGTAGLDRVR